MILGIFCNRETADSDRLKSAASREKSADKDKGLDHDQANDVDDDEEEDDDDDLDWLDGSSSANVFGSSVAYAEVEASLQALRYSGGDHRGMGMSTSMSSSSAPSSSSSSPAASSSSNTSSSSNNNNNNHDEGDSGLRLMELVTAISTATGTVNPTQPNQPYTTQLIPRIPTQPHDSLRAYILSTHSLLFTSISPLKPIKRSPFIYPFYRLSHTNITLYSVSCTFNVHSLSCTFHAIDTRLLRLMERKFYLSTHLLALKKFMLLGQGDFVTCLMDSVGPELKKRATQLYRHNLTGTLEGALRASNAQFEPSYVLDRVGVRLLEASPGDSGWEVFSLDYAVDSPLNAVVHAEAMARYRIAFHMLWRLKRVEWYVQSYYYYYIPTHFLLTTPDVHDLSLKNT